MAKFAEVSGQPGTYIFDCPGCGFGHRINTNHGTGEPVWGFNKDLNNPTVSPSILVTYPYGEKRENRRCHSYVRNGKIEFLGDCTHELRNQTVELPEL